MMPSWMCHELGLIYFLDRVKRVAATFSSSLWNNPLLNSLASFFSHFTSSQIFFLVKNQGIFQIFSIDHYGAEVIKLGQREMCSGDRCLIFTVVLSNTLHYDFGFTLKRIEQTL